MTDAAGAPLPGVTIALDTATGPMDATSSADGTFQVSRVPAGEVTVTADLEGFAAQSTTFAFDGSPHRLSFTLKVDGVMETITVQADAPAVQTQRMDREYVQPSQNVINLQRRARRRSGDRREPAIQATMTKKKGLPR